jgi:hypothetical protein
LRLDKAQRERNIEKLIARDVSDSELFRRFPELRSQADDEGLLPLALFGFFKGALSYKGFVLAPSRLVPAPLGFEIAKLGQGGGLSIRLAIDHFAICPVGQYGEPFAKARVWGMPFGSKILLDHLYDPRSVAVFERFAKDELEELMFSLRAPVKRLEICRGERRDRVALLIEELPPIRDEDLEVGYVSSRIFHCDLELGAEDLAGLRFAHVDASHLVYDIDTYMRRLDSPGEKIKAKTKQKLFYFPAARFDQWRDLLIATFPNDELIGEWLTGERQSV